MTHGKSPWCGEGLRAGGEGDNRVWDCWMTSPSPCPGVWVNSRSWWWTGRTGVLRFMGSQRVGHDWATELNWAEQTSLVMCDSSWWDKANLVIHSDTCTLKIPLSMYQVGNIFCRLITYRMLNTYMSSYKFHIILNSLNLCLLLYNIAVILFKIVTVFRIKGNEGWTVSAI